MHQINRLAHNGQTKRSGGQKSPSGVQQQQQQGEEQQEE